MPPEHSGLVLRPADPGDAAAVADVHLAARHGAVPAMPPPAHPDEEVRAWLGSRFGTGDEIWVAEQEGAVVGYARFVEEWLDDLYVVPAQAGHGIGSALLDLVKARRPGGFSLWVFESNAPARAFYARHGLVELRRTDGSANEEKAPDLELAWPGTAPLDFLRRRIDEVDTELADLLERRVRLTAAVQPYKPVGGHAGRDADREAEIVDRMAGRTQVVPREALVRVVHELIHAGLEAARTAGTTDAAAKR